MSRFDIDKAKLVLAEDPVMAELLDRFSGLEQASRDDYFTSLCRAIVGQQLSVKAADTIFKRFESFLGGELTASKVLSMDDNSAREQGLSWQKISYLKDLALKESEEDLLSGLDKLPDDEVIKTLTSVKGIGKWTAQMFLMFTLSRTDIFAVDDLGLRRAIEASYGVAKDSPLKAYQEISLQWAPYRSLASMLLWRSLDNKPKTK